MPEATFMCLDTSEYSRNRDYGMTRLMGMVDAANIITGSKLQSNPENTIGFLTMAGSHCVVHESLTGDVDRMLASLSRVKSQGELHLAEGLRIGSLALAHRANTKGEKRLIAFVTSPISVPQESLTKLAKKLRKDEIALDVINIGNEDNTPVLTAFVEAVNKNSNSRYLHIPAPCSIPDTVVSSPVLGGIGGAGAAGGDGFDMGVDPNVDPELAMVLRMSAEEERRRQEALQGGGAAPASSDAPTQPSAPSAVAPVPPASVDEDMELALKLSAEMEAQRQQEEKQQQQASASSQSAPSPSSSATPAAPTAPAPSAPTQPSGDLTEEEQMALALKMSVEQDDAEAVFDDIVNDEAFLQQAAEAAGVDPNKVVPKKPDPKK